MKLYKLFDLYDFMNFKKLTFANYFSKIEKYLVYIH